MKNINFNFYDLKVNVYSSVHLVTLELLAKDFFAFLAENNQDGPSFKLEIFHSEPPWSEVPVINSTMQTISSICYDSGSIRYVDYYGESLVILDLKKNSAKLFSKNLSRLHEISYLLILSRVGKLMDLKGLHKLHAFSVSYKDLAIVCMMPMKGGKSTLLMEFLKDSRFKMISDDIPIINFKGEVLSFPLKIGLSKIPNELKVLNPEKNIYSMDRGQYGIKQLLSLEGIPGQFESPGKVFKKVILIEAFRCNSSSSILKNAGMLDTFYGLTKHGIIGIGLPMVIEYFWEKGAIDFLTKTNILLRRLLAFLCLLFRSRRLKLYLGKNPNEAFEVIAHRAISYYEKN